MLWIWKMAAATIWTPRYWIVWGGEDACEVVCEGGRYDLELFAGRDVGIHGTVLRDVGLTGGGEAATAPLIDVGRLAVLSRR